MSKKSSITILYDSECPFCTKYVELLRLRQNFDVRLVSARIESEIKSKATLARLNLDKGMVVEYGEKLYYGAQAFFILSTLSTPSDFFNKMMSKLFASKWVVEFCYPFFAFIRHMALLVLQRDLIDNMPRAPEKKIFGLFSQHNLRDIAASKVLLQDFCIRLTSFCLLLTIFQTFDLWFTEQRIFSPVPTFRYSMPTPFFLTQLLSACVVLGCIALFIKPRLKIVARLVVASLVFLILEDELRWQPFIYMYMFILFALSFYRREQKDGLAAVRYMVIGIYFWAGFYKISWLFVLSIFPWFVAPLGLNPIFVFWVGCAVPFIESLIGVFLLFKKTRVYGVVLASCMLIVVLLCLGPLGSNWGAIVWPWNVLLHVIELLLFLFFKESLLTKEVLRDRLVWISIMLFWLLPALAMVSKWGSHPSFMLYSPLPQRASIQFAPNEDLNFLPISPHLEIENDGKPIDLNMIVSSQFNVVPTPSIADNRLMLLGARGLCSHLLFPDQAKLIIYALPHIWSLKYDEKSYPLCSQEAEMNNS